MSLLELSWTMRKDLKAPIAQVERPRWKVFGEQIDVGERKPQIPGMSSGPLYRLNLKLGYCSRHS